MRLAVYAAFLVDGAMVILAVAAARRLHPRTATRLLAATAVVVAGSWTAALGVLAAGSFGGLVVAANLDRRPTSLGLPTPVPGGIEVVALLVLVLSGVRGLRALGRLVHAARDRRALMSGRPDTELMVVDDAAAIAFVLPGRPGRIVASATMLRALDAEGRRALLAHERAHLRLHHHIYVALVDVAVAICPVLIPVRAKVRFGMERWADEDAAEELGGRRPIARALACAGMAATPQPAPSLAFGATSVPARIEALLVDAPPRQRWPLLWPAAMGLSAVLLAAEAVHDLERLFELAVRVGR